MQFVHPKLIWDFRIISLAVATRLAAIVLLQGHLVPNSTYEHGSIAENLLAGRGFSIEFLGAEGPTSQQAPVYPVLVAAAYAVGGVGHPNALLFLFVCQAVLGGLLTMGCMRLVQSLLPGRQLAGWLAGMIVALHPSLVYAATHVQVAGLAATLLVWVLVLAQNAAVSTSPKTAAWLGALFGCLVLTDPILGLCAPAAAWIFIRDARDWKSAYIRGTIATVAALAVVTPWIARNATVHGQFVPVKSTFGYAFWQGNCRLSAGTDKVIRTTVNSVLEEKLAQRPGSLAGYNAALWAARHEAGYIDDIALTHEDKNVLGQLPEPDRSRALFQRALAELKDEPGRYSALCLARLKAFLLFDETNPKTRSLLYRTTHLSLTGLALLGLGVAGNQARRRLAPTLLVCFLLTLFHTLTIVSSRFHIPIEPLLAAWAGVGVATIWEIISGKPLQVGSESPAF